MIGEESAQAIQDSQVDRDTGGHYSRPDVLQLVVHKRHLNRVIESGDMDSIAASVVNRQADSMFCAPAFAPDKDWKKQAQ